MTEGKVTLELYLPRIALSLLASGEPHASYQQVKLYLNNLGWKALFIHIFLLLAINWNSTGFYSSQERDILR